MNKQCRLQFQLQLWTVTEGEIKSNTPTLQYGLPGYRNSVEKIKHLEWNFISSPLINHAGTHLSDSLHALAVKIRQRSVCFG